MAVFNDRHGVEWLVEINVAQVKRVRSELNLDLGKLIEDEAKPLRELLDDTIRLVDTVYVLCRKQAEDRNMDDVKFGESISGESLETLGSAFINALVDFFQPSQGQLLRKMIEKGRLAQRILAERMEMRIDEISPEEIAEKVLTSYDSHASSPAYAESIRGDTRFEN